MKSSVNAGFIRYAGVACSVAMVGVLTSEAGFFDSLSKAAQTAIQVKEAIAPTQPPPPPPVVVQQPVYVQPQPVAVQQPVYQQAQPVAAQQPVYQQAQPVAVQQPVYQQTQPAAAQPVVAQPAVAAPAAVAEPVAAAPATVPAAAPAATVPAVPVAQPPAVDTAALMGMSSTAAETAEPELKWGTIQLKKPATAAQVEAFKTKYQASKDKPDETEVYLENPDDATLAAVLVRFPETKKLTIGKTSKLTSLAPLALLKNATEVTIKDLDNVKDFSPLAALVNVEELKLNYCTIYDFSFAGALVKMTELNLYGSVLKTDFTPVAAAPSLKEVNYYATKGTKEIYDTLGNLKQVKRFHGGLSQITDLGWLKNVPQTEELEVFAEKIADYSPVSSLVNLKRFRAWSMKQGYNSLAVGDLSFLAACKKLKELELPSSDYSNTAALAALTELERCDFSEAECVVDLAFAASCPKLKDINISSVRKPVTGFDALKGHPALSSIRLTRAKKYPDNGVKSIAVLESCPKLTNVRVSTNAFPAAEISALKAQIGKRTSWGGLREEED